MKRSHYRSAQIAVGGAGNSRTEDFHRGLPLAARDSGRPNSDASRGLKYLAILVFLICVSSIASYRIRSGYRTPDEVVFSEGVLLERSYSDGVTLLGGDNTVNLKYVITTYIQKHIFRNQSQLIYAVNCGLVVWAMILSHQLFVEKHRVLNVVTWAMLFLLPNVAFYTVTLLRDIYGFVAVCLFLICYLENRTLGLLGSWLMATLLRPELGVVLLLAGALNARRMRLILGSMVMYILAYYWFFDWFANRYVHSVKTYDTLGIWEFAYLPENLTRAMITNISLFFVPFLKNDNLGTMAKAFTLESWLALGVIIVGVASFSARRFTQDKLYRLALLVLFFYFPIASMEHNAWAASRHVLPMLPMLWFACLSFPCVERRNLASASMNGVGCGQLHFLKRMQAISQPLSVRT